ncbi:MAG TPA: hypothetical protein VEB19_19300 [Gemmatimonadaceae bacterium]|nr:hypothetical protein [Gemmatimonadaceae bacterium]
MRRLAILSALVLAVGCDEGEPAFGFVPAPLPASRLAISVQPSNAPINTSIAPPVRVSVLNSRGEVVTSTAVPVTMTITPGTGTAGANLTGQTVVAAESGVATFNNLRVNLAGTGYTLTASAPGLTQATTTAFEITP